MGRIFNVLVPVIVLSAYFQDGSGFCNSRNGFGTLTGTGGYTGGAAGSVALVGQAENSGARGGASWSSGTAANSGTGNGYGFINTGNSMLNDGSAYGNDYARGMGNSVSSWSTGYYGNSAAYGSGSATGNGFYSNFGNGGGSLGYSQGGGAYNGGFNAQYGSDSVSGGSGETIQYNSHPGHSFLREVASDIADTVVDAIEVGHSLMHRPYVKQNYVRYSRPAYVRQVVRVPGRVVSVRRGYRYGGCGH